MIIGNVLSPYRQPYGSASSGFTQANYSYYFDNTFTHNVYAGDILDSVFAGATPTFSIRMVVRKLSTGAVCYLMSKLLSTGNQRQFALRFTTTDALELLISPDGTSTNQSLLRTTSTFTDTSAWLDIVLVFDGNQSGANKVKFYVNGTLEAHTLVSGTPGAIYSGTARLFLAMFDGGNVPFNGYLNQEGVTSDLITSDEVTSLYNSGSPRILSDICDNVELEYIHNDDTFSTSWTLIDNSGNGYNGTAQNLGSADRDGNETPYA